MAKRMEYVVKTWHFDILESGDRVKATAQIVDKKLWIHLAGQILSFEIKAAKETGLRRRSTKSVDDSKNIKAPMPGKITKIFKKVNEKFLSGEPIIIMEAMKMEYTLKAHKEGVVKQINAQVGEQVELGKVLVEFE